MKRILINATHNEEVRVALCKGNHLYDFDLENRTREQKKSNIYKGHVTRVEPSLEAVFVEYGSKRQGFLPVREIASEYLSGNPREENIRKLIKEGDELIVQVEKEERGNKGAALSTYVSLAGRYLVLMPNNPKGGGISRQISGKLREDMKRMLGNLDLPKGMSVIVRTAGIGKTQDDLQHDLNHLLNIWNAIQEQNKKYASPRLVHQEAGVVTRAVRDYLRDDISEIWIDNEEAFIEAETFIKAVMPTQIDKLRKYTDFEPMFSSFNVERQIETAYQREVRLPSGGSIVIDQTEALVSIDINSAKSTKGADVSETAYHTNLEASDEIARQLRLRDMGGLIVIDYIDMNDNKHQKEVEKRLVEATKYDRARVQFGEISRFGLMEMSRQRLRPSLEESTGYICPRCHGNGMIRDLRSLSLSIMRQIEQTALKERHGEVQAEVPTDIAAFLLNEKRESLVYLEQDSGTRITILPHAHLESPNFNLHFNHQGFAPASYERITDTQQQETSGLGYEVDWQTADSERPEQQPIRQPRTSDSKPIADKNNQSSNATTHQSNNVTNTTNANNRPNSNAEPANKVESSSASTKAPTQAIPHSTQPMQAEVEQNKPAAVAWLSNLFAPTPQAEMSATVSSADAAKAIEAIVNTGVESRGAFGQVNATALASTTPTTTSPVNNTSVKDSRSNQESTQDSTQDNGDKPESDSERERRRSRNNRSRNNKSKRPDRNKPDNRRRNQERDDKAPDQTTQSTESNTDKNNYSPVKEAQKELPKREANSRRESRGAIERGETKQPSKPNNRSDRQASKDNQSSSSRPNVALDERNIDPTEVNLRVTEAETLLKEVAVVHISLDDPKSATVETDKVKVDSDVTSKSEPQPQPKVQSNDTSRTPKTNSAASKDAQDPLDAKDRPVEVNNKQHEGDVRSQVANDRDTVPSNTVPSNTVSLNTVPLNTVSKVTDSKEKDLEVSELKGTESQQAEPKDKETSQSFKSVSKTPDADNKVDPKASVTPTKTEATTASVETTDAGSNSFETKFETEEAESSHPALGFDVESLFAERYVAAKKFGQASNDPRAVKASMRQQQPKQKAPQTSDNSSAAFISSTANAISGTVGQFIHTHLAQPRMRLAKDGAIICFLAALNAHKETSGLANKPSVKSHASNRKATETKVTGSEMTGSKMTGEEVTDTNATKTMPEFSFVNYGYQSLSPSYLERFSQMTSAVAVYNVDQGKTEVEPTPIGARAANDPRGQHPDYTPPAKEVSKPAVEATDSSERLDIDALPAAEDDPVNEVNTLQSETPVEEPSVEDTTVEELAVEETTVEETPQSAPTTFSADPVEQKSPAQAMGELLKLNVGDFVSKVLGQDGIDILQSGQTEAAFLKALRQPLDVLMLVAQKVEGSLNQTSTNNVELDDVVEQSASVLAQEPQADAVSEESTDRLLETQDQALEADSQLEQSLDEQAANGTNKTSIETYKSMIENISEQLLPQTGLLNLTSPKVPKVPKSRSRKVKDDTKQTDSEDSNSNDS